MIWNDCGAAGKPANTKAGNMVLAERRTMGKRNTFAEKAAEYIKEQMLDCGAVEAYAQDRSTLVVEATGDHRHTHGALGDFVRQYAALQGCAVEETERTEPSDSDWYTSVHTYRFKRPNSTILKERRKK